MKKNLLSSLIVSALTASAAAHAVEPEDFNQLTFRNIGPSGMSGRVTSVDVVENNRHIIYVGTSAGGLWKSVNNGTNFKPIFENQKTASVGDVAIFQQNPNVIYMGTGEGNPRNSQSFGHGVYKSLDGGKTWTHLGLENTLNIHRIIVHPHNPDIVWVGAQGAAYGETEDRGVYKSTDGGKSWKKVLYTNKSTGIGDLIIDPTNPNKLIAGMWEFGRKPWTFNSGGEGSAIYISHDGGENWTKAKKGLPKGLLGRVGLSISPKNPEVVYAFVESKDHNAMYRSNDGGESWSKGAQEIGGGGDRPFYYADVEVDPQDPDTVYHIAANVSKSTDGGKTFNAITNFFGGVHSDHHAFWINPDNPKHILDGNDGGLYASFDGGKTWGFHHNIPVGQFYHINVDNEIPYNVYGGMQDNGSWMGPAYKFSALGEFAKINNQDFRNIGFGDGFDVIPDPVDSRYGYSMSQGGNFQRYDLKTGGITGIKPYLAGETLRFNWDAALAVDPIDKKTLYAGSQYLLKSTDHGLSWSIMSPDLTTNDPEKQKQHLSGGLTIDDTTAENHTTITVIEPAANDEGVIWVGTDDGNLQITRDGGKTWKNVIKKVRGLPKNTRVKQIKHSSYNKGEAFAVFDGHRKNDFKPYVYHTKNYGKSWKRLVDEKDVWGYALSFAQDPVEPKLMFVGTEFGLYVSFDAGKKWQQWNKDFPTVSTMDMVIHPKEHDLVVGTFGRSVWVLDDIRPLREMTSDKAIEDKSLHLFDIGHAYQPTMAFPNLFMGADDSFKAPNRKAGALINFWAKEKSKKDAISIEISDKDGKVIHTLKATAKPGVNRVSWDLKTKGGQVPGKPDLFTSFFMGGAPVMFGDYTVTIKMGEDTQSKTVTILKDNDFPISDEMYATNIERRNEFLALAERSMKSWKDITGTLKAAKGIKALLAKDSEFHEKLDAVIKKAEALKLDLLPKPVKGGLTGSNMNDLRNQLLQLGGYFSEMQAPPSPGADAIMADVVKRVDQVTGDIDSFMKDEVEPLKASVNKTATIWQ